MSLRRYQRAPSVHDVFVESPLQKNGVDVVFWSRMDGMRNKACSVMDTLITVLLPDL